MRWQDAQVGFWRWRSNCSRTVFGAPCLLLSSSVGTFGTGGGGGVLKNVVRTYLPRKTGEVRVATDVSDSTLPWPRRPNRFASVSFTWRKREPYTFGMR
jgi:hypothetical protein